MNQPVMNLGSSKVSCLSYLTLWSLKELEFLKLFLGILWPRYVTLTVDFLL